MKKYFFATILIVFSMIGGCKKSAPKITLNGAGASFPFPLYSVWSYKYSKNSGVQVNYQSVGSGAGIAQIKQKTVDFGASDKPLKPDELEKFGLVQFPTVMGGVVPVVNIDGIKNGELKLTGKILAEIFLGKIKKWNDPQIVSVNPKLKLPKSEIKVVHRADGSGTTWIFTDYLSKVSENWKSEIGTGKSVKWNVGLSPKNIRETTLAVTEASINAEKVAV